MFWYRNDSLPPQPPIWYLISKSDFCDSDFWTHSPTLTDFPLFSTLTDFPLFSGGTHLFTGANGLRRRGRQTYTRYLAENTKDKIGRVTNRRITKYKTEKPIADNIFLQIPDAWVGKGISHESLPHAETQNRDGPPALSHRETNQNLVPEQVRCPQIFWPYFSSICHLVEFFVALGWPQM